MARWQATRKGSEDIEEGVREERPERVLEMEFAMVEVARREIVVCMVEIVNAF